MSRRSETSHWKIPGSWEWTKLGDIAQVVGGGTPRTDDLQNYMDGDIPWITPADLSGYKSKLIGKGARNITLSGLMSSGAQIMPAGTVLFSSRAPIGYVAIASNELSTSQGFKSFVLYTGVLPDYVYYYLQRAREIARSLASGTTFLEISGAKAALIPIPLAPRNEQGFIVAEVEKQFTRLDDAVGALKRVQANLKRYRASVLKAACEGRVVPTEAERARKERRDYEPASELLKRILAGQRAKWEANQLQKMFGRKPTTNDEWKKKYKEPAVPDKAHLEGLPTGWAWATVDQIKGSGPNAITDGPFGSNLKTEHYTSRGPRVIRLQNVGDAEFIDSVAHISRQHFKKLKKHEAAAGDIVIAALGDRAPRACLIPKIGPAIVKADCIKLTTAEGIIPAYVSYALNSDGVQKRTTARIHGVGRPRLNLTEIKEIVLPIPPTAEQRLIVEVLDTQLSVESATRHYAKTMIEKSNVLRYAVLKRAYEGTLVPQDPNDEPASALLHRIVTEARAKALSKRDSRPEGERFLKRRNERKRKAIIEVLKLNKAGMLPENLLSAAGYGPDTIDDFYAELKVGVDAGQIDEHRAGAKITLRARQS